MDEHIEEFFSEYSEKKEEGNFFRAINLNKTVDVSWETLSFNIPNLPKGWYELSLLDRDDRIQFTFEYWLSKLPYQPYIDEKLAEFFGSLDDILVFITKKRIQDTFDVHMVYSLADNRGFYRGGVPASEENIIYLQKLFPEYILPEDYLAFLQIHDGFWKTTDCTGVTSSKKMNESYKKFLSLIEDKIPIRTKSGKLIDHKALIPFYESFGHSSYQCFWAEWHPKQEMGNVYYSVNEDTFIDIDEIDNEVLEKMAFPTFSDWLIFYLEQIKEV